MRTVELKTAYHWNCDECGADNFDLGIKPEFGPGEKEEFFRNIHGLEDFSELPEDWEKFEAVAIPDVVTCCECGEVFATIDERLMEDDDE